jgi:Predicted outer membrane protein
MNIKSASATLGMTLLAAGLLIAVPRANAATTVSTADKDFILAAAQGGMTEVKLGELAAQKGTRDDVKAFGQMMVKDHTAINDDLKALAAQKGVTLPDSLDAKHQGMVDKMAALTGSEFDDAYIAGMIKDHKMDAKEFKAESAETKDADIKSFVDKSIPVVDEHLKRITAMKK